MTGPDFDAFRALLLKRSGLSLTPEKAYLVKARLEPIARAEGLPGAEALLTRLRAGGDEALVARCVDAMATHETSFFRDGKPLEQLAEVILPQLMARRLATRRLRLWSAACSSGQEVYSTAIALKELGPRLAGWTVEIVATDMAPAILRKAAAGLYSDFEVKRGLSPERLARWFTQEGGHWRVSPELRAMASFRPHNLLDGAAGLGVFDVILCRNVLIYFGLDLKRTVLGQLERALAPDGALVLGSAETVLGVTGGFTAVAETRGVYRPAAQAAAGSPKLAGMG